LTNGDGWLPSWQPAEGWLLHAPLFLELAEWCAKCRSSGKKWAHGNPVSFGDDLAGSAEEELRRTRERGEEDPEILREAIRRARALGVDSEEVTDAEYRLEELRFERPESVTAPTAPDTGAAEVAPPEAAAKHEARVAAEPSGAVAAALQELAAAAAAGDAAAIRSATKAAKVAGAGKREIARVFALSGTIAG